jgi:hypothetical protein
MAFASLVVGLVEDQHRRNTCHLLSGIAAILA